MGKGTGYMDDGLDYASRVQEVKTWSGLPYLIPSYLSTIHISYDRPPRRLGLGFGGALLPILINTPRLQKPQI